MIVMEGDGSRQLRVRYGRVNALWDNLLMQNRHILQLEPALFQHSRCHELFL